MWPQTPNNIATLLILLLLYGEKTNQCWIAHNIYVVCYACGIWHTKQTERAFTLGIGLAEWIRCRRPTIFLQFSTPTRSNRMPGNRASRLNIPTSETVQTCTVQSNYYLKSNKILFNIKKRIAYTEWSIKTTLV